MPNSASRFSGTYKMLPPREVAPPIPPEQKGARYLADKLQSYGDAELELTLTDGSAAAPRVEGRLRATTRRSIATCTCTRMARSVWTSVASLGSRRVGCHRRCRFPGRGPAGGA